VKSKASTWQSSQIKTDTLWRSRLRLALKAMSLWDVVDGTRVRPAVGIDGSLEPLNKWMRDDDRANYYISNAVSDNILTLADQTSARSVWTSIATQYGSRSEEKVHQIFQRIMEHKMSTVCQTVSTLKLKNLYTQVENASETISEKFKISILLWSLTDEYSVKRQVLI